MLGGKEGARMDQAGGYLDLIRQNGQPTKRRGAGREPRGLEGGKERKREEERRRPVG